jgi:hypothetical protein
VGNGDSWQFRGRGLAFVTLKDNYRRWGDVASFTELVEKPELIFIPSINAKIFVESRFPRQHLSKMQELLESRSLEDLRQIVLKVSQQNQREEKSIADDINNRYRMFAKCLKEANLQ